MKKDKENKEEKPKLPPKKSDMIIFKPIFDLNIYKKEEGFIDDSIKDKPLRWIPLSDAFAEATGLPGLAMGYCQLFRGYTNTGKSTAVYEAVIGCQKIGVLPVILDLETNWSWQRASEMGIEFKEVISPDTGEIISYDGFFIYIDNDILIKKYGNFDYSDGKIKKEYRTECAIEDIAHFVNDLLDQQANGKLGVELCFLLDSLGVTNCFRSITSKSSNNMWNAGAMESAFKVIFNHKIPSSRKEGKLYTNTFMAVQKVWLDNQGSGVLKNKLGEAAGYGARIVVQFGGVLSNAITALVATCNKKQYTYGIQAKVKVIKNHVTGVSFENNIISTTHGFWSVQNKGTYATKYKNFILNKLHIESGELELSEEEVKGDSLINDFEK